MRIEHSMIGNVHVLTPTGNLMGADALLAIVNEVAAAGPAKVVVYLGKISWINSVGYGGLIRARRTCDNSHGWLRLARPAERIRETLPQISITTFPVFETVEEAVAADEAGYNRS